MKYGGFLSIFPFLAIQWHPDHRNGRCDPGLLRPCDVFGRHLQWSCLQRGHHRGTGMRRLCLVEGWKGKGQEERGRRWFLWMFTRCSSIFPYDVHRFCSFGKSKHQWHTFSRHFFSFRNINNTQETSTTVPAQLRVPFRWETSWILRCIQTWPAAYSATGRGLDHRNLLGKRPSESGHLPRSPWKLPRPLKLFNHRQQWYIIHIYVFTVFIQNIYIYK